MSDNRSFYGNDTQVEIPGISREVMAMAADRLMPPQFDEFCAAMRNEKVSPATRSYWKNIADAWQEVIDESADDEVDAADPSALQWRS